MESPESHRSKPCSSPTTTTCETPAPDNPSRSLLLSRQSASFSPPSLQKISLNNPRPIGAIPPQLGNAEEQLHLPEPHTIRPDVNSTMPSGMAYSETRTLLDDQSRALGALRIGTDSSISDMESRPKNDDVFLNIARSDTSRRRDSLAGRSEFRRSRLGYTQSLRSPTARFDSEQPPSTPDQRFSNGDSPLLLQEPHSSPKNPHSSAISAHPLDEPARHRYSSYNSGSRSTVGAPRSRFSRTSPDSSPRAPEVNIERRVSLHEARLRHSNLSSLRGNRQPSESDTTERADEETDKTRAEESESTLSTNAPSTVWDELDDLKSRIRKLELTGKLPPSSHAAITGSNDRPRTAATTVTALSTSPKHRRKISSSFTETESAPKNQLQPVLQSALAKAKSVLSHGVYKALEATVTDALTVSNLLGVSGAPSGAASIVDGYSSSERRARRKADSLCRSLTEFCLALTDDELRKNQAQTTQPNVSDSPSMPTAQRGASLEPEVQMRQSTSRITNRYQDRRQSMINISSGSGNTVESPQDQSPSISLPPTRLNRYSTSLQARRLADEESPNNRPLSRSATMSEIDSPNPGQVVSPAQRLSYGYSRLASRSISNNQQEHGPASRRQELGLRISPQSAQYQPSPSQAPTSQPPQTPTTPSHTGIPLRRSSYMTPGTYTPMTSRSNIQAGSRRYGFSSSLASGTPRSGAEESPRTPQLQQSQTRLSMPSGKSVSSYTPISQPRPRANSLGARKFGLRYRSTAPPSESVVNMEDSID
ncbi:hypothetical protein N7495_008451 [Penicillium taxi]|uniref:uncharacterized protein n=1 Tax=Penicillium taxi TaxID=168475 RepID=UPI002545B1DD|nr:uncharacterized protein N7495_008451 [Penicillium taxi]KAJ5888410.1 hypothetical protein N7495_008451 [Penicillium taxi]